MEGRSSYALRGSSVTSPPVRCVVLAGRRILKVKVRSGECRIIKALEEVAWKVYNMGTIFGRKQTLCSELPQYADYLVVPSPGITGEIVTPNRITDWKAIIRSSSNWDLLGEVKAPKGSVSIYRNQVPVEKRDFSTATAWIRRCNINAHAR